MELFTPDGKYFNRENQSKLVVNTQTPSSPETFHTPLTVETEHSLQLSVTDGGLNKIVKDSNSLQKSDSGNVDPHENSGQGSFTENESDEIVDNHSVISEASVSLLSHQSFQLRDYTSRQSYDKLVTQVKKLRKENASLKEALSQANITDIMLLKTKLRGMQADLLRYRQLNNELKERIQLLEEKQFQLLTNQVAQSSSSRTVKIEEDTKYRGANELEENESSPFDDQPESISQKLKHQFQQRLKKQKEDYNISIESQNPSRNLASHQDYLPINPNPSQNNSVLKNYDEEHRESDAHKAKLRHYEKLLRVYEKNMSIMQNEIDELKSMKSATKEGENNFDDRRSAFLPAPDLMASPAPKVPSQAASHSSNDRQEAQRMVEFSVSEDLQNETKPLTIDENLMKKRYNQLSRDMKLLVEEYRGRDQKTITELANEVKRLTKILPKKQVEELDETREEIEVKGSEPITTAEPDVRLNVGEENLMVKTPEASAQTSNDNNRYSVVHLLIAFCIGCFLMLFWLSK